jgi:cytochrome c oxidase cbb3-type subunit 4
MDVNMLRAVITATSFVVFVGIVVWAYSAKSKRRFDEAAQLPFADDDR